MQRRVAGADDLLPLCERLESLVAGLEDAPGARAASLRRLSSRALNLASRGALVYERGAYVAAAVDVRAARAALLLADELTAVRATPRGYVAASPEADDPEARLHRWFSRRARPLAADLVLVWEDLEDRAGHGWRDAAETLITVVDVRESEDVTPEAGTRRLADACRVAFGDAAAAPPSPDPEAREAQMLALVLCRMCLEAALAAVEATGTGGDREVAAREIANVDAALTAAEGLADAPAVDALRAATRRPAGR